MEEEEAFSMQTNRLFSNELGEREREQREKWRIRHPPTAYVIRRRETMRRSIHPTESSYP